MSRERALPDPPRRLILSETKDFLPDVAIDAERVAAIALAEDGLRDITTEICVPADAQGTGQIEFRSGGILAGAAYADAVARACECGPVSWATTEGQPVAANTMVGTLRGPLAGILRAERPILNLLQRGCGIASLTRRHVEAVAGTSCRILHTRKTTPGLREFEVRAVLAGGGHTHRLDLWHAVMVKDNHWQALRSSGIGLSAALARARSLGREDLYVEVETVEQLEEGCAAGATRLLIDNQPAETVRLWGAKARGLSAGIKIEASGGITLVNVREYALAGADFVSIGGLTHSVPAADLALGVMT